MITAEYYHCHYLPDLPPTLHDDPELLKVPCGLPLTEATRIRRVMKYMCIL